MSIDKRTEEQIKERADIVSVIGDFLELRKKGIFYECLCPFHNDRHLGSFKINPRKQSYKCYSCDEGGDSIAFLMKYRGMTYPDALRYLAAKFGVWIDEESQQKYRDVKPAKPRALVVQSSDLPKRTWPAKWVEAYQHTEHDTLCQWLRSLPWSNVQRERLEKVLQEYRVGHISITDRHNERHEFTAWWEIDTQGTVHNCHLMKYNADGHRDKTSDFSQTWLHARMRYADPRRQRPFDDRIEQASYCLFGEHLLAQYPNATVRIVESEKSAIIMATAYGNDDRSIWLACCGKQNLNPERLAPIMKEHREMMLLPDRDGIDSWREKEQALNYSRVSIDTSYVTRWWKEQDGDKADCADVVLRSITEAAERRKSKDSDQAVLPKIHNEPSRLSEVIKRHPILGPLVEDLQLTETDERRDEQRTTTAQADQAED